MPIGGSATLLAARALAAKIRVIAGTLLEAHPDDVELVDGRAVIRGTARALSYTELARTVHFRSSALKGLEPSLEATVHYTNAQPWTFTNGAHLAVVEVDVDTGRVSVLRYVAVDDCGRIVNPALVEGQIAGGVAQGLGGALFEHCAYDDSGQLLTASLMEYAVPTAADLPPFELHHLETLAPSIAGGFKGAGEAGTTGAPAPSSTRSTTPSPHWRAHLRPAGDAGACAPRARSHLTRSVFSSRLRLGAGAVNGRVRERGPGTTGGRSV
jgi:carbon-monoxide dehydrogenase large subunit